MKKLTPKVNMTIANLLMGAGVVYYTIDMIVYGMEAIRCGSGWRRCSLALYYGQVPPLR